MHPNTCSLECNFDKLQLLLHNLDYNFDVITLTETCHVEAKNIYDRSFLNYLKETNKKNRKEKKKIILTSDFNQNPLKFEKNKEVEESIQFSTAQWFTSQILRPTRNFEFNCSKH